MRHLAYLAQVVLVDAEVDEFVQLPGDVPETNVADFGFASPLTNAPKKENKSAICINLIANKLKYMYP